MGEKKEGTQFSLVFFNLWERLQSVLLMQFIYFFKWLQLWDMYRMPAMCQVTLDMEDTQRCPGKGRDSCY